MSTADQNPTLRLALKFEIYISKSQNRRADGWVGSWLLTKIMPPGLPTRSLLWPSFGKGSTSLLWVTDQLHCCSNFSGVRLSWAVTVFLKRYISTFDNRHRLVHIDMLYCYGFISCNVNIIYPSLSLCEIGSDY